MSPNAARADAVRNRERLLEVARATFATVEPGQASLERIAREAGVGIGTLYRHFPTREALVVAVFDTELAALCDGAPDLLAEHPPAVALRIWMDRYAQFVATKRGMAETLREVITSGAVVMAQTRARINGAVAAILSAGARDGSLRADVQAPDLAASITGVFLATTNIARHTGSTAQPAQVGRMLDLLVAGVTRT